MDPKELMTRLAACRRDWQGLELSDVPYVAMGRVGRDVVRAIGSGCRDRWLGEVFGIVEQAMTSSGSLAQNLVVVGMFEAMLGPAYELEGRPDRLDEWLLPASSAAWHDLIEGWVGRGVRTVEAWQRVIVNGPWVAIRWTRSPVRWDEVQAAGRLCWEAGSRRLTDEEQQRVAAAFSPLVARALAAPGELEAPETLVVEGGRRTVRIELCGDLATDGRRWFLLDVAGLRGAWPSRVP